MSTPPPWTRDELILALDLYFKVQPHRTNKDNPNIIRLSELLNALPFHARQDENRFRNPNGVYMKLCNFLRLDPSYAGKGLRSGSRLDIAVWNAFSSDKTALENLAQSIKRVCALSPTDQTRIALSTMEDEGFPEGRVLSRVHQYKERSGEAPKKKKSQTLKEKGVLACEVCGFDFQAKYGQAGEGFIECHHSVPISSLTEETVTSIKDLNLVCSNCHRILHRVRPWITVEQLKERIVTMARENAPGGS